MPETLAAKVIDGGCAASRGRRSMTTRASATLLAVALLAGCTPPGAKVPAPADEHLAPGVAFLRTRGPNTTRVPSLSSS